MAHRSASAPGPPGRRRHRRPVLLQLVGIGFAVIAAIHAAALLGAALQTSTLEQSATLTLPFPPAPLATMEPAAGPDQDTATVADQRSAAAALPEAPEAWGEASGARCEPRLLRAMRERREQLDARAAEIADRVRTLEVIEKRVAEQVRALEEQRDALEATLTNAEQADDAELARLVTIYESMKPKEAARIFEAMPAAVAAGFIRRMREAKSAVIMANLGAGHAYAITLALANGGETTRH
jgi:flagellar motility protein MotE (MotC chaperone)